MRRAAGRSVGVLVLCLVTSGCTAAAPAADPGAGTTVRDAPTAPTPTSGPPSPPAPATVPPSAPPAAAAPAATPSPPPALDDADAVVAFVREGVTPQQRTRLAELEGVAAVSGSRRDDLALWGSRDAEGREADAFPPDHAVVLTALTADPDDAVVPTPPRGAVLLTAAGATLRRVGAGGTVVVGPGRRELRVADVLGEDLDDEAVGSAEVVLHPRDADALDQEPLDRVALVLAPGAAPRRVARAVAEVLPDEARVVVRPAGRGRVTLPVSLVKARFGEFSFRDVDGRAIDQDDAWVEDSIVTAQVPLLGAVRCHRRILAPLRAALQEVADAGLGDRIDPARYGGCWAPRRIGPGEGLSKHAWGIALDINVDFSVPGGGEVPPPAVVAAFRRNGFAWGGDFPTPDNHHFEWVGRDVAA